MTANWMKVHAQNKVITAFQAMYTNKVSYMLSWQLIG